MKWLNTKAHTFANRYMPPHRPKFAKECAFTYPSKIVFKKFPTLQKIKNTQRTQPTTDKHFDNLH